MMALMMQAVAEYGAVTGGSASTGIGAAERKLAALWELAGDNPMIPIAILLAVFVIARLLRTGSYHS